MRTVKLCVNLTVYTFTTYYSLKFHLTHSFDGDAKNVGIGKTFFVWELLLSKLFLFQKVNFDLYLH